MKEIPYFRVATKIDPISKCSLFWFDLFRIFFRGNKNPQSICFKNELFVFIENKLLLFAEQFSTFRHDEHSNLKWKTVKDELQ